MNKLTAAWESAKATASPLARLDESTEGFHEWEHVLFSGADTYVKAAHYRLLAALTRNGLLTSESDASAHNHVAEAEPTVTLRPRHGLPMRLTPR